MLILAPSNPFEIHAHFPNTLRNTFGSGNDLCFSSCWYGLSTWTKYIFTTGSYKNGATTIGVVNPQPSKFLSTYLSQQKLRQILLLLKGIILLYRLRRLVTKTIQVPSTPYTTAFRATITNIKTVQSKMITKFRAGRLSLLLFSALKSEDGYPY